MQLFKPIWPQRIFAFLSGVTLLVVSSVSPLSALSAEQKSLIDQGIDYYNLGCSPTANAAKSDTASPGTGPIYMMGDSITQGAKKNLEAEFKNNKLDASQIDGVGSRSFVSKGAGSQNGIQALESDTEYIKKSNSVIIALGTNGEDTEGKSTTFEKNSKKALSIVRAANPNATIYWVNLFSDSPPISHKTAYNKVITGLDNVSVINMDKENISLSDKVHPDSSGYKKYAKVVAESINNSAPSSVEPTKYISAGNIPKEGKTYTATVYGTKGKKDGNGKYVEDLSGIEGGPKDEVGKTLKGRPVVAELKGNTALGGLPHGAKIEITYKDKRVVAEVSDNGPAGGGDVDIWRELADLMSLPYDKTPVKVHAVPQSTPLSSVDGTADKTTDTAQSSSVSADCACSLDQSATDTGEPVSSDGQVYNSGLKAPFILEQWAIHTLKAVAQKRGVDESKAVTKEHVVALVAFAIGEGGDIQNQDLYNPLNTGLNAPELINGTQRNDGVQSFKSFDAGVEAAARTMVGSNQNRLASVLTKPESTAKDFMTALTYFQRYKGNKFWAGASLPPNQDSYYAERLNLIKQVRGDYKNLAGLVIGTPEKEQAVGKKNIGLLTFDGSGSVVSDDSPDDTSACECKPAGTDTGPGTLAGKNNQEKAYRRFVQLGASEAEAAGMVGNFMQESGENLDTRASNGSHEGIGQWDVKDRWPQLLEFAKKSEYKGKGPRSLIVQIDFAWSESATKEFLRAKTKTPEEAAVKFEALFERSGGSALDKRQSNARSVYDSYAKGETQASAPAGSCDGSASGEQAFIDGQYAWPVALNKSEVSAGYPLPCKSKSCHHDGSAAFDLAHKDTVTIDKPGPSDKKSAGRAVFAITDGSLAKINIYKGIAGCYALQFKSSDGYVYWYGHLGNPVSQSVGKKFKAGDKIAEIGQRKCTGNDSYPHLHIDRGSPKGQFGGNVGSRDPGMNTVINNLYSKLP